MDTTKDASPGAVAGQVDCNVRPRFERISCSQCGGEFGPGDHGFSHCSDHLARETAQDMQRKKFADMRHYLNEAHQFAAMSPRGKENIEAALAILDELEA